MNKKILSIGIFLIGLISIGTVSIFTYFIYHSQLKSINEISKEIHSSYLQEIIYNLKNEIVSGNYRSFRAQMAGMIDRKIFTDYRLTQNANVLDSTENFESRLRMSEFEKIYIPVWFDEQKTNLWGEVEMLVSREDPQAKITIFFYGKLGLFICLIVFVALVLVLFYTIVWRNFNFSLSAQINEIFAKGSFSKNNLSSILWAPMLIQLRELKLSNDSLMQTEQDNKIQKMFSEVSTQVAHDIRSPLSVLNLTLSSLNSISQDEKMILKGAADRINDIANSLLSHKKMPNRPNNLDKFDIPKKNLISLVSLVGQMVEEKKIQYKDFFEQGNIFNFEHDEFEIYVEGFSSEISRILSNLINNSVEALEPRGGQLVVRVFAEKDYGVIVVFDNGKGIPAHILNKLGAEPVTFGKAIHESGTGLGVFYAKKMITEMGGSIKINSRENFFTSIEVRIPILRQ